MRKVRLTPGPVVVDVVGTTLAEEDLARIRHPAAGAVILFARNYESPAQLAALCEDIQRQREPELPICVDHEGGRVQRFKEGFTRIPPMRHLGKLWDRDREKGRAAAAAIGYVIAAELGAHGLDFSFTPVLDLDYGGS
jgi:beta-N-acetylhexosaminidase